MAVRSGSGAEQRGQIYGLAAGDARARTRVDACDVVPREEDAEDQVSRLTPPAPRRRHGHAQPEHVEALLADHRAFDNASAVPRRDLAREEDAASFALQVGLHDVGPAAEGLRAEGGASDVAGDGGGFGRREEALATELPEERQEGLALGDQHVRGRQEGNCASRGGLDEESPARLREPVEGIVAKEYVESLACKADPAAFCHEIIRTRDLNLR